MAVFSKFCTVAIWDVLVFHTYLRTKTVLFWVITQREVVISYQYFGTSYRSHPLCGRSLKSHISKNVCNVNNCPTSLLYFCKLLYMFWVVTPPVIRSTYNCNYSIWHWSNRLCYLPLLWSSWNNCNYSCMCSWWWVKLPPKTCRAVYRNIISCM